MRSFVFLLCLASTLYACGSAPKPRKGLFSLDYSHDGYCTQLTQNDRKRILQWASPKNYPKARYRKGPRSPLSIEKETDCSRFVHEIYRRSGLPYSFKSTAELREAPEFDVMDEGNAQPGDLMLFRGHVGIIDENGLIISATKVRRKGQSSITRMERSNFQGFRGRGKVLRYRCRPGVALQADTP